MSDHGTSYMEKNFFLNAWLKKEGYLFRKKSIVEYLNYLGINIQNIATILDKLHLKNTLGKSEMLRKIGEKLPEKAGLRRGLGGEATLEGVNLDRTRVISPPQGPIYINKNVLHSKDEYENLRKELVAKLSNIKDEEKQKKVFKGVYKREEIYNGEYVEKAPDLMALDSDFYHNRGGLLKSELFYKSEWKGNNAQYGIFLINGPDIKKDFKVDKISIYDLAPLILSLYNIKPPKDLDGVFRYSIFTTDFKLKMDVNEVREHNHKEEIKDKIENMKKHGVV